MRRGVINKFNRGELDPRSFMRDDVEKVTNAGELFENFLPQRLGPMQYRSGTKHIARLPQSSAYQVAFISSTLNPALVALNQYGANVFYNDAPVVELRGTITITNGDFVSSLSGWTDASGPGAITAWDGSEAAALIGGYDSAAKLWQTAVGGVGQDQHIVVIVFDAPITLKIGQSGPDSDEIFNGVLEPGYHSLRFTPTVAPPTFTLINNSRIRSLVGKLNVGADNVLLLPFWISQITNLASLRSAQSADVMFFAHDNGPQFKIQRWGNNSWSLVGYRTDDGPFGLVNNTDVTLTPTVFSGEGNLLASGNLFTSADIGRLYKLTSASQELYATVTKDNSGMVNSIRVTGVDTIRDFTVSISGGWSGKITLQRSPDGVSWEDWRNYTGNTTKTENDDLDNAIMYYRLWVNAGDFTSGVADLSLVYASGSVDGICRVVGVTDAKNANIQVLRDFGALVPTLDWYAGEWGGSKRYPTAVALYEGRLWWGGRSVLWGSVSDAYASFGDDVEGDSAPIRRTIGFGPVDRVEWITPSSRLIMGLASDEIAVRSSSFGEVLTQLNVNLKSNSSQGSAAVEPVKVDDSILFVQRGRNKLIKADYVVDQDAHGNSDMMTLHPEICRPGIVRMAVTRNPETRVYIVLSNGEMRVHLMDPAEDVVAWSRITLPGGLVRDVAVIPGDDEDIVYVVVQRAGGTFLERFYPTRDYVAHHFDRSVDFANPGTTLTGLTHMVSSTVGIWANGRDRGTAVVSGAGTVTIPSGLTNVTVGLRYNARYKSAKVSRYIDASVIGRRKRVVDVHMAVKDYLPSAMSLGASFSQLDPVPTVEFGKPIDPDEMILDYDEVPFSFEGDNEVDSRICIQASGPCTIMALSYGVLTQDEEIDQR